MNRMINSFQLISAKPEAEVIANLKYVGENKEKPYVAEALSCQSLKDKVEGYYDSIEDESSYTRLEEICGFLKGFEGIKMDDFSKDMIVGEQKRYKEISEKEGLKFKDRLIKCATMLGGGFITSMAYRYLRNKGLEIGDPLDCALTFTSISSMFIGIGYAYAILNLFESENPTPIKNQLFEAVSYADNYIKAYNDVQKIKNSLETVR